MWLDRSAEMMLYSINFWVNYLKTVWQYGGQRARFIQIFQMALFSQVYLTWPAHILNLWMFFLQPICRGKTSFNCAYETARPWHRAAESLSVKTALPHISTSTAYMSAGEIRLCYIPSLMSSVLIISRHNTSCSSRFPAKQTDQEAGAHHLKMQTCSCYDVSQWWWFYGVPYGLCWWRKYCWWWWCIV